MAASRAHAPWASPLAMFAICVAGMAGGLVLDSRAVHPDAMASLCTSAADLLSRLTVHWRVMPMTHAMMLLAAGLAVVAEWPALRASSWLAGLWRVGGHAACLLAMLTGMALAAQSGPRFSTYLGVSPFVGLVTAMVAGMSVGMLLSMPLYRHRQRAP